MSLTLRLAKIDDLPLIEDWNKKPHVIFATGGEIDEEDKWMEEQLQNPSQYVQIYLAELDKQPIGIVQIIDPAKEESHYWGDIEENLRAIDIWIGEEENLGKGYGTIMMNLALDKCFGDSEVTAVIIDPLEINKRAIKFYQKIGFNFVENKYFEDDYCAVHRITRQKWQNRKSVSSQR